MNWDEMRGQWAERKHTVRERWQELTDEDLIVIDGDREYLVAVLQQRYGTTRDAMEAQVKEFERHLEEPQHTKKTPKGKTATEPHRKTA